MNGDLDGEPDMKRWLGSALSGEPPLALDRDEIFRQGRRRLRNRKLFQAGGAVTGVVAVVVGAVLVGGLVGGEPSVPPAATGTAPVSTTSDPGPPASQPAPTSEAPVSSTTSSPGMEIDERANRLTHVLAESGVLPSGYTLEPVPDTGGPTFRRIHPSVYGMEADLHTPDASGWLWVLVEKGPGVGATCDVIEPPVDRCEVRDELGMPMTIAVQKFDSGEIRRVVRSVRPDGCYVTVTSSNLTATSRDKGVPPSGTAWPALPEPKMIKIAALPELTVG